jgi:tRNA (guanine-N7-)-methyltransferase
MVSRVFQAPHLISAKTLDKYPMRWNQIFHGDGPLGVEIGFGNGEFLVDWAKRQPDWNFVGIDSSWGSMERLEKRTRQNSLNNIRIINDDAPFCLRELFPDNSVNQVVMNFPDPWPKKRHRERRMLKPSFIQTLGAVLAKGGIFELVTDQDWLAHDCHALLDHANRFFELTPIERNPVRPLRTKYERKWRHAGCDTYYVKAIKIKDTAISRMLENIEMPHCIIENEILPGQVIVLKDTEYIEGDRFFIVKQIYTDFDTESYLCRAVARDIEYQQSFYISISKRQSTWLVRLDETCPVFNTPAVKMAVLKIGEILSTGHK